MCYGWCMVYDKISDPDVPTKWRRELLKSTPLAPTCPVHYSRAVSSTIPFHETRVFSFTVRVYYSPALPLWSPSKRLLHCEQTSYPSLSSLCLPLWSYAVTPTQLLQDLVPLRHLFSWVRPLWHGKRSLILMYLQRPPISKKFTVEFTMKKSPLKGLVVRPI